MLSATFQRLWRQSTCWRFNSPVPSMKSENTAFSDLAPHKNGEQPRCRGIIGSHVDYIPHSTPNKPFNRDWRNLCCSLSGFLLSVSPQNCSCPIQSRRSGFQCTPVMAALPGKNHNWLLTDLSRNTGFNHRWRKARFWVLSKFLQVLLSLPSLGRNPQGGFIYNF